MFARDTDPYRFLSYVIGSEDDFWCFDYEWDKEAKKVRIHAVINSETGHFIENAEEPAHLPEHEAVEYAKALTSRALEWCAENDVEHDIEGWNQDPTFFWRSLHCDLTGGGRAIRVPLKMKKRPLITRNYL